MVPIKWDPFPKVPYPLTTALTKLSVLSSLPRKVIELGCGVGLLGCVISHLCDQITLTDYHESVLKAARHTLEVNSVSNGTVSALDWSNSCGEEDSVDIVVAAGTV